MNKILKYIALLFLFLFGYTDFAFGQEDYKNKFSASSMISYFRNNRWGGGNSSSVNITGPQLAYTFRNKWKNWHEFELLAFSVSNYNYTNNGGFGASLGLRYQYNIFILKTAFNGKLKPFVAPGILSSNLYSRNREAVDRNNNIDFARKSLRNTSYLNVSPGIEYNFLPKFYTTFQIPINIASFEKNYSRVYDPSYSVREQRNNRSLVEALPFRSLDMRLTFGYRF